jgi:putative glutamine amidotransferase
VNAAPVVPGRLRRSVAILAGRSPVERYSLHRGYVDAVAEAGGLPLVVPAGPGLDPDAILELVCRCDALVVTGGGDVDPVFYGAAPVDGLMETDPARDQIEIAAVHAMAARGRPVLGVCRGAQVLAVASGGTLVADLPSAGYSGHWEEERQCEPVHGIEADAGSLALAALAGAAEVNSIHHQAIAGLGPTLRATAWSPDGVVEAVEAPGALGVQWHPERLCAGDPRHLAPFSWVLCA